MAAPSKYNLEQRAQMLDATNWADGFSYKQIQWLARYLDARDYPSGQQLFREGDDSSSMSLVVQGQVEVHKEDPKGKQKVLTSVGRGKTFGEMALIDGQPRSASVRTSEETTLLVMSKSAYERLSKDAPALSLKLTQKLAQMMSVRLRGTSGQLIEFLEAAAK